MYPETLKPIVPFLNGNSRAVLDAAVKAAYGDQRQICWMDLSASGNLPASGLIRAIRQFHLAMVGPQDLDMEICRTLDLYARVWPVRHFQGLSSPMKDPTRLNVVIFGQITGDSNQDPQRLVRMAIRYALANDCNLVTLVDSDPDFTKSGYGVACGEFGVQTATEVQIWQNHRGTIPPGKMMINDRGAEAVFQQLMLRPEEHKILVAPVPVCNYLAKLCAAQAGITGFAPVAAFGDEIGVFEAAGNPFSGILSGIMLLDYLRWTEAADLLSAAFARMIAGEMAPGDLAGAMIKSATY